MIRLHTLTDHIQNARGIYTIIAIAEKPIENGAEPLSWLRLFKSHLKDSLYRDLARDESQLLERQGEILSPMRKAQLHTIINLIGLETQAFEVFAADKWAVISFEVSRCSFAVA